MEPAAPKPAVLTGRKKMLRSLAFAVGGAVMGFAYYKLVGCRTGACPITSSPVVSTLYGAFLGYLISGSG
jgi:hypothetical protein